MAHDSRDDTHDMALLSSGAPGANRPPGSASSADGRVIGVPAPIRAAAAALLLAALPLHAAAITIPTYRAQAHAAGSDGDTDEGGPSAKAEAAGFTIIGAAAQGSAIASGSGLGAGGKVAMVARTLHGDVDGIWNSATVSGGGVARFRIDDLVFTRDDPTDTRSVPVATLLPIDGVFFVRRDDGANSWARAYLGVEYGLGVPGVGSTAFLRTIGGIQYGETGNAVGQSDLSHSAYGIFAGLAGQSMIDGVFVSPVFDVPVNVPALLNINLSASAAIVARDGSTAEAMADFMNTLAFRPGGPIFVLPDRVSARSVTAGIDGNSWPGGSPNNPPAPVPLPPAAGLLAAALAGLGFLSRHRV